MIYSINEGIIIPSEKGKQIAKDNVESVSRVIEADIKFAEGKVNIIESSVKQILNNPLMPRSMRDKLEATLNTLDDEDYRLNNQRVSDLRKLYDYKSIRFAHLADRLFDNDTNDAYKNLIKKCAKDGEYSVRIYRLSDRLTKIGSDITAKLPNIDTYNQNFYDMLDGYIDAMNWMISWVNRTFGDTNIVKYKGNLKKYLEGTIFESVEFI